jgi:hypothetical protein
MDRAVKAILYTPAGGSRVITQFATFPTDRTNAGRDIGRALFKMNIEAVMQRYPDCRADPSHLPGWDGCQTMPETYDFNDWRPMTVADLTGCLEALHCLRYQCSEGNVPETDLFAALQSACTLLAETIIETLPNYTRAAW